MNRDRDDPAAWAARAMELLRSARLSLLVERLTGPVCPSAPRASA
jgi:hypothetical protein